MLFIAQKFAKPWIIEKIIEKLLRGEIRINFLYRFIDFLPKKI